MSATSPQPEPIGWGTTRLRACLPDDRGRLLEMRTQQQARYSLSEITRFPTFALRRCQRQVCGEVSAEDPPPCALSY
ncbi:MAG: hypothetical protein ABI870_08140, partial [Rhodanobacter sp.]